MMIGYAVGFAVKQNLPQTASHRGFFRGSLRRHQLEVENIAKATQFVETGGRRLMYRNTVGFCEIILPDIQFLPEFIERNGARRDMQTLQHRRPGQF